jgi:NADH-quinone oxidoreductase subunit M
MTDTIAGLVIIPVIGAVVIMILPIDQIEDKNRVKSVGRIVSILTLLESMRLWVRFDETSADYQYIVKLQWIVESSVGKTNNMMFGTDGISMVFIVLTTLLIPICILVSWESIRYMEKAFILNLIAIEVLLIGVFTVIDLLGFYILFEGILIPMYLIIGIWGSRNEKVVAAYYFFFYTLIGSVLMLIGIIYMYKLLGTTDYMIMLTYEIPANVQNWLFLALFSSLAVKIPKWPFHIWLPQAHVEAPVAGSIILAGILIKLGAYGFIRFALPILPLGSEVFTPLVYTLGAVAIVYASLTTIRQTDMKRIIAYSSVGHMAVVMLAIFSQSVMAIEASIFMQLAHGIVSSALFILVTRLYDRHHTRLVKYYRGIAITMPIFASIFLIMTLANIGTPLTCNFIGEITSLMATYQANPIIGIIGSLGMILSATYALFFYNRVVFGSVSPYLATALNRDITKREWWVILPLLILTIVLGIMPNIVYNIIHTSVIALLIR